MDFKAGVVVLMVVVFGDASSKYLPSSNVSLNSILEMIRP